MLYLGAPIWANKAWVGTFFPEGARQRDFLSLYSRRLNTVEGNTTFYGIPSAETVARWRDETPPGFKFCLKFPKAITHERRLRGAEAETAEFAERLTVLDDRAGPCLLQLPPSFSAHNLPALLSYLDGLPALPGGWRVAVEVRHPDFFGGPAEAALDDALRQRRAARVLYDQRGLRSAEPTDAATRLAQARKPNVPVRFTRTAPFAFVRYISHPHLPANAPLLDEWATHAAEWLTAGDDVFFFCHHKMDYYAPALARDFHGRVARLTPLPPLPNWDEQPPSEPLQASLF
jgi:uncharacterized protein YecE (DUF72 family)